MEDPGKRVRSPLDSRTLFATASESFPTARPDDERVCLLEGEADLSGELLRPAFGAAGRLRAPGPGDLGLVGLDLVAQRQKTMRERWGLIRNDQ